MYFYYTLRFISAVIFKIVFRFKIQGVENVPEEGKVILCSNHISVLDPIVLAIVIKRPIIFMAKKELFENKFLGKIINGLGAISVDRQGASLSAVRQSLKTLKSEKVLGIFPEGTRVKEVNLDNGKPGVGLIAIKSKSPIVPIYIESKYKPFSKIKVNVGEPISFDEYYGEKLSTEDYTNISKDIMKSIYGLKQI